MAEKYSKTYTIISIIFALVTAIYIGSQASYFIDFLFNPKERYFGIPILDNLLNYLVAIFLEAINDPTSLLYHHYGTPLFIVVLYTYALEASIPSTSGLITQYLLFATCSQFVAVSITIPLLWIPAWIASENRKSNLTEQQQQQQQPVTTNTLNPTHVDRIFWGIFITTMVSMVAMDFYTNPTLQLWSIIFFQFAPMLAMVFWKRKPQEISPEIAELNIIEGYKQAANYYLLLFGISVYSWIYFWVHGSDNNFLYINTLITQFFNGESAPGSNLLFADLFFVGVSMIYWVYLVEGAKFTSRFGTLLWNCVVLSPGGAIALYNYERYLMKSNGKDINSRSRYGSTSNEATPLL
ncbi:hypothetical protein Glove_326g136 [Diversispora epigaea]|uniref:Uncharacterized protein n=1 Tax=Diversispora epigaea TaxID=1348612 RepID=A0A397HS18_9GLOM|nr:hypothetical protein Glove_326g136 [Diversispora epigaea]